MGEPLNIGARLEALEAEVLPPTKSLSLRHRVRTIEADLMPGEYLGLRHRVRALEAIESVELPEPPPIPPIPLDLCERIEDLESRARLARESIGSLEEGAKDAAREIGALERRNPSADLERRFESRIDNVEANVEEIVDNLRTRIESIERRPTGSKDLERVEAAFVSLETKVEARGDFRVGHDVRISDLEDFRGRFIAMLEERDARLATLDSFRMAHADSIVNLDGCLRELERFRGRFDEDLVVLTRRIASLERPEALAEAVEQWIATPLRLSLAEEIERIDATIDSLARLGPRVDRLERPDWLNGELAGIRIRLVDLERARNLVLDKLQELGAWTSPKELSRLEESLRNEAAQLTGRANSANSDAPFDGEAAEALYHVGSAISTATLALIAAIKSGRPPGAGPQEPQ